MPPLTGWTDALETTGRRSICDSKIAWPLSRGRRGIGQAYCLALAREGASIVAADILSCAATVAQVQQAGGEALGVTADVANAQSTQAMAAQTVQHFGRIDILVNNAAIYGGLKLTPFEQIPRPNGIRSWRSTSRASGCASRRTSHEAAG